MNDLNKLTVDALHNGDYANNRSCLVSNTAGLRLLQADATALPVIENVLRTVVEPLLIMKSSEMRQENDNLFSDKFRGLDYVLGAYLVIGTKFDPNRVVEFLSKSNVRLIAETLAAMPAFFQRIKGAYNFGTAPAPELVEFVRKQLESECGYVRHLANRVLLKCAAKPGS